MSFEHKKKNIFNVLRNKGHKKGGSRGRDKHSETIFMNKVSKELKSIKELPQNPSIFFPLCERN